MSQKPCASISMTVNKTNQPNVYMFIKRATDLCIASIGIILLSPLMIFFATLIWLEDYNTPFFLQPRTGKNGKKFRMIKLRSMRIDATAHNVDTTSESDERITQIGSVIRKYKFDEVPQLFNVLMGDMSIVGPRPQTLGEAQLYTSQERHIFSVKPGITDIASIVFLDLQEIVAGQKDPNLAYHQLVRPWKSRFCLFYIENRSFLLDLLIVKLTILCVFSSKNARMLLSRVLQSYGASEELSHLAKRQTELSPTPPPGRSQTVRIKDLKPKLSPKKNVINYHKTAKTEEF
jgi:lipopolysaccharide/colanic/teichoic acid biosynthesis glycosyltransferase